MLTVIENNVLTSGATSSSNFRIENISGDKKLYDKRKENQSASHET